jgi:hypothetical protein
VALGGIGIGAFTPETALFNELESAAKETGEKVQNTSNKYIIYLIFI